MQNTPKNTSVIEICLCFIIGLPGAFFFSTYFLRFWERSLFIQILLILVLSLLITILIYSIIFWFLPSVGINPFKKSKRYQPINPHQARLLLKIGWTVFGLLFIATLMVHIQPFPQPWFWKNLEIPKEQIQPSYHGPYGYSVLLKNVPGMLDGSYVMSILSEDGLALGPSNSVHSDIGTMGSGRFSLWKDGVLYFSASNNSDPRTNGKNYVLSVPIPVAARWVVLGWSVTALFLLILAGTYWWKYQNVIKQYWKKAILCSNAFFLVYLPMIIAIVYYFSSTHPMVYGMTFCIYYPLVFLLNKMVSSKISIIIMIMVLVVLISSRIAPWAREKHIMDTKDLSVLSTYSVPGGTSIEQDFYLPHTDWRLDNLINDPDVDAVLRIVGKMDEKTLIYINDKNIGTFSEQLIFTKPDPLYGVQNAYDHFLHIPKESLRGQTKVTIKISSPTDYLMGYSNGLSPLPRIPHARQISIGGVIEDISSKYSSHRFRFAIIIYLVSQNKAISGDPLILGSIR